jgi:hypothetical protein
MGDPADSTKWYMHDEKCDSPNSYACPKNSNVFQDGLGNLVIRTKRETTNWLAGGQYSGGWLSTFRYGYGWPPPIKASWPTPYHIEMRAMYPNTPGAWGGGWNMSVDRTTSQQIHEVDWAEERTTQATRYDCHQHTWLSGSDTNPWNCAGVTISDMGKNWHTYSADVYDDHVVYKVDGIVSGTAGGAPGRHGLVLQMGIAPPGSWGSGGGQPASTDPGPWDMTVDYVRVTAAS